MTQARAVLAGTGICVPPLEVDNTMLSRIIETSDSWVRERSGIGTRYYVEPGVGSSDLGAEAGDGGGWIGIPCLQQALPPEHNQGGVTQRGAG